MTSTGDLLPIAVEAVNHGAHLVRTRVPNQLTAKGDRDYASNVDYEIERDLQAFLAEATPHIGFLGEEEGMVRSGQRHWALDPIDGTVNFANAMPLCAVSLALVEDDRPLLGVIQLPFLNQTYTAVHGQGAFRDQHRLKAAVPVRLRDAIVSIGDYAVGLDAEAKNADRLAVTSALAGEVLRVRMFGSAAIDLAWVAEGITGAVVMLANKPWDTAAGAVIAREAGARVVDIDGTDHTSRSRATIAVAPSIADELLTLVQKAIEPPCIRPRDGHRGIEEGSERVDLREFYNPPRPH
jgi:myo-inositol-1(or 4)-monophosphatase